VTQLEHHKVRTSPGTRKFTFILLRQQHGGSSEGHNPHWGGGGTYMLEGEYVEGTYMLEGKYIMLEEERV